MPDSAPSPGTDRRPGRLWIAAPAALLCLCLFVPACTLSYVYEGAPLPADAARVLRHGMTKAQVLSIFGPPDLMGLRLDGSVFVYRYRHESEAGFRLSAFQASVSYDASDARTDRLVVFFDKRGRVTSVGEKRRP